MVQIGAEWEVPGDVCWVRALQEPKNRAAEPSILPSCKNGICKFVHCTKQIDAIRLSDLLSFFSEFNNHISINKIWKKFNQSTEKSYVRALP